MVKQSLWQSGHCLRAVTVVEGVGPGREVGEGRQDSLACTMVRHLDLLLSHMGSEGESRAEAS